ncbi:MAG: PAS domain S-box protein [Deltaproteobacteria bacterium]|nr:PAS domain S-box protein [Deltaproteobacteria bacterium]
MKTRKTGLQGSGELRQQAEKIAQARKSRMPENIEVLSPEAAHRLLHELRVHQVELEMQNEELRRVQEQLEVSRARYFDLYDLAPVGYVTLSEQGLILEANLTIITLLGVTKGALVKQPLTRFIDREDQDIHYRHRKQLLETGASQVYEVRMRRREAGLFWARLEAVAVQNAEGVFFHRVTVSDITPRIRAEQAERCATEELKKTHQALEVRVEERTSEIRILSARLLAAQEDERKRIAMDLHDGLGGLLSAIKYKVEAAQGLQEVKEVLPYLQQAIAECRRVQLHLRPSMLDNIGLLPTLNWLIREFQKSNPGLEIEQQFEIEEEEVPLSLKTVIFRITQETLNNIFKHSGSSWMHLALRNSNGALQLTIRDTGQGFAVEKESAVPGSDHGFGLAIMRERVEWSGGIFSIQSVLGKGTMVQASWPEEPRDVGLASDKNA